MTFGSKLTGGFLLFKNYLFRHFSFSSTDTVNLCNNDTFSQRIIMHGSKLSQDYCEHASPCETDNAVYKALVYILQYSQVSKILRINSR